MARIYRVEMENIIFEVSADFLFYTGDNNGTEIIEFYDKNGFICSVEKNKVKVISKH